MNTTEAPDRIWFRTTAQLGRLIYTESLDAHAEGDIEYLKATSVAHWVSVKERLPEEMGFYMCRMEAEPEMGTRIDVVFYAIKGYGSMATKETGWAEPVLYKWANHKVSHWLSNVPSIPTEEK